MNPNGAFESSIFGALRRLQLIPGPQVKVGFESAGAATAPAVMQGLSGGGGGGGSVVSTGSVETLIGGRIKRAGKFVDNEPFLLTYGDGVSDVDIQKLVEFHKSHGKLATMTAIQPEGRFGALDISKNNEINSFIEKPKRDND